MLIRSLTLISLVGIGLSGCFPLRDNSILENVLIETLARPVVKTVVGGFVLGFNYVDDQLTETKPKDVWKYCQRSNGSLFQARVCSGGAITITKSEYENRKNKKPVTAIKATGPSEKMVYCKRRNGSVYSYTNVGSNQCAKNKKITKDEYDSLKDKKPVTAATGDMAQEELSETKPSSKDRPTKAKLKELKDLLYRGLITEKEAAEKRAKLLEDL